MEATDYAKINTGVHDTTIVVPSDRFRWRCNRALHGDRVIYDIEKNIVSDIIQRVKHRFPAVVQLNKTKLIKSTKSGGIIQKCIPVDWRYPEFLVSSKIKKQLTRKAGDLGLRNQYILAEFQEWTEKQKHPMARQIEVIGEVGKLDVEEKVLLFLNRLNQSKISTPLQHTPQTILSNPTNNGTVMTFGVEQYVLAIDPAGSLDYDDAFHVTLDDEGKVREIGVHIADVTHYFSSGGQHDLEFRKRLTTIYLISRKINMIPDSFADDKCSLISGKPRPTTSVLFRYDKDGKELIDQRRFIKSVTTVTTNMTYEHADHIINNKRNHKSNLITMCGFFGVDDSHQLVEKLMIMCNHAVGNLLYQQGYGLIRTQRESIGDIKLAKVDSDAFNRMSNYVRHRGSNSAEYHYNPEYTTHKTLGLDCYTHFTSPIRRYPDQICHRLVHQIIDHSKSSNDFVSEQFCLEMNRYFKRVKKLYRQLNVLRLFHRLNTEHCGTYQTTGYPIDYQDGVVYVYLPEFELEHKYRLFPKIVDHLVKVTISGNHIQVNIEDEILELTLYQNYPVKLFTNNVTARLSQKVRMRIL